MWHGRTGATHRVMHITHGYVNVTFGTGNASSTRISMTRPSSSQPTAVEDEPDDAEVGARADAKRTTGELEPQDRRERRVVYVIDDSEDARDLVRESLRDAGYRVIEARNGREALDLLLEQPTPSAIVLDLLMPVMDGYEVLELLASYMRLTQVPTLVVSAASDQLETQLPYAKCLRKPIDPDAVVAALEELIAKSRSRGR
jgi:CheY-like chemotaxis protein